MPDEKLNQILEENGSSLTDEEKSELLSSVEERALTGQGIASGLAKSRTAPSPPRWETFITAAKTECMRRFRENDELYYAVSTVFPSDNKVRIYISPDNKRHLKIINDLEPVDTGFENYWNTVIVNLSRSTSSTVHDLLGVSAPWPLAPDPYCINSENDNGAIDPGSYLIYDFPEKYSGGNYELGIWIGTFVPNMFTLFDICTTGLVEVPFSQLNNEEFGLEVFGSEGVTLDCATYSNPNCTLWKFYQMQTTCRGTIDHKAFTHIVNNHCSGTTYEIKLSGLLADGSDLRDQPPLCDVHALAAGE